MRGKISVISELNKGTVFIIEIPVEAEILVKGNGEQNSINIQQTNEAAVNSNKEVEDTPKSSN
jgi:chemotaxis protein histidine kinase CheA